MDYLIKGLLFLVHLTHLVPVDSWEWTLEYNRAILDVLWLFWFLWRFFILLLWTFFVFAIVHVSQLLNLFMLEYVNKDDTCHMGIVSSLMVVWKKTCSFIISETIFDVEASFDVLLKFAIACNFLVQLSKTCLEKYFGILCKKFSVIMTWEFRIPRFTELFVSVWKLIYELVVEIEPIIVTIVPDQWYLVIDDGLDNQWKS